MHRYLVRRLAAMIPIVIGATLIVFVFGRLAPGDPVQILFGDIRDPAAEARARASLGLDRPLPEQYVRFLINLTRFDLGTSYAYPGRRVSRMVLDALPISLMVGGMAVCLALMIGLPLGILAAVHRHGLIDRLVRLLTLLGVAVPFFVIAVAMILFLSLRLRVLPVAGWGSPAHFVLPVVVLTLRPMAYITRITRLAMLRCWAKTTSAPRVPRASRRAPWI